MTISRGLNIFVCGRFHYHKYSSNLGSNLNKLFYSYKVKETFGINKTKRRNLFIKEYLLYAHLKLIGDFGLWLMLPIYHWIWTRQVLLGLEVAEANIFLAHGNCLPIMKECKKRGALVVAEVVNAHPAEFHMLMEREHHQLGIEYRQRGSIDSRIISEVQFADIVLAPSKFVAQSFISRGVDRSKIRVINYGAFTQHGKHVNISESKKLIRNKAMFKILCVAKITPRKGQYHLLKAVNQLREEYGVAFKIELTFVGEVDGGYFTIIKKLNIPFEHVRHINNQQMCQFMSGYDLLVLPSIEDGFGVVVGEALSVGVPVVTTSTSGAADIVEQISSCLVVPPSNSNALADSIRGVIDNRIDYQSVFIPGWSDYAAKLCAEISLSDRCT